MTALPRSLADNPQLDRWIGFEPDRTVRLATGKVELGQGVLTALTQIAAEELDVEPSRVRIVSGDTDHTPNEGYTTGSLSIEISGGSIRLVCAEVRRLFVQRLAAELRCDPAELAVVDGKFLRGQTDTDYDYWRLAPDVDLARDATGGAPVKHPSREGRENAQRGCGNDEYGSSQQSSSGFFQYPSLGFDNLPYRPDIGVWHSLFQFQDRGVNIFR